MNKKTMGQQLLFAVTSALHSKKNGTILRPKIKVAYIRKQLHMSQAVKKTHYRIVNSAVVASPELFAGRGNPGCF